VAKLASLNSDVERNKNATLKFKKQRGSVSQLQPTAALIQTNESSDDK